MDPLEAMQRVESQLAHVWMVRTFLKHSEEGAEDEELQEIFRTLYDFHLAVGGAWSNQDAETYLRLAAKKLSKLRAACETFVRVQPEVSAHTNFQMAARSLTAAVVEIGRILEGSRVEP